MDNLNITQIIEMLESTYLSVKHSLLECFHQVLMKDESFDSVKNGGARGRVKGLLGTLEINCGKNGQPLSAKIVGHGRRSLSHYVWIPIVFVPDDPTIQPCSYCLFLGRSSVDAATGNDHFEPRYLSICKHENSGPEVGGQTNPAPRRTQHHGVPAIHRLDMVGNLFPIGLSACSGRNLHHDKTPFGLDLECPIPCMDMGSPQFNPKAIVSLMLEIIKADLNRTQKKLAA